MNKDTPLQTSRLEAGISLPRIGAAQSAAITLESPAMLVMTDLTVVKAVSVDRRANLRHAEQTMIDQGVRMLFVVTDETVIEGLLTSTDLHGDQQVRIVNERALHYDDLTVADIMTQFASLDAIAYNDMTHATIANLVATLKRFGRNHLLVVEAATASAPGRVRGVVSRSQIARQLGMPVEITPIAGTFSEINRALV
ncbi:MAG: CBS domain-containing protein [Pseudomonadota bacterium]|nr:CBS domain-containing protein [Pseudomonadota bacterium]